VECQIHFLIENTIIILDLLDPCLRRSSLEILYILQFIFSWIHMSCHSSQCRCCFIWSNYG